MWLGVFTNGINKTRTKTKVNNKTNNVNLKLN